MDSATFTILPEGSVGKINNEVYRLISNRRLKPLLALHLDPINVVIYYEPSNREISSWSRFRA
jgi:hypothetical protein